MRWWIILIGIVCILIGVFLLRDVVKNPIPEEQDFNKINLQSYIGGFGFIALGVTLLYREII